MSPEQKRATHLPNANVPTSNGAGAESRGAPSGGPCNVRSQKRDKAVKKRSTPCLRKNESKEWGSPTGSGKGHWLYTICARILYTTAGKNHAARHGNALPTKRGVCSGIARKGEARRPREGGLGRIINLIRRPGRGTHTGRGGAGGDYYFALGRASTGGHQNSGA